MGTDLFLQLLVTQMRYQDPLSGQQDTGQLMTQLTLFTLVEQVTKLQQAVAQQGAALAHTRALGLLNRRVEVMGTDGTLRQGEVSAVAFQQGRTLLTVGAQEYPDSAVTRVEGDFFYGF